MGLISNTKLGDLPDRISNSKEFDENEIWAFTLDYDSDCQVILLDEDAPPCVDAVELWDGKRMTRAATLSSTGADCPFTNLLEETGNKKFRPKKFFIFTVLDLRGFEKQDGTEVLYSKKALMVKAHMMDKFFRKKLIKLQEKHGSLRGIRFDVGRGPKMNPSPPGCGDSWDFDEVVDLSEFEGTEVLTEPEVLSLFITEPDELAQLAEKWRELADSEEPTKARY